MDTFEILIDKKKQHHLPLTLFEQTCLLFKLRRNITNTLLQVRKKLFYTNEYKCTNFFFYIYINMQLAAGNRNEYEVTKTPRRGKRAIHLSSHSRRHSPLNITHVRRPAYTYCVAHHFLGSEPKQLFSEIIIFIENKHIFQND